MDYSRIERSIIGLLWLMLFLAVIISISSCVGSKQKTKTSSKIETKEIDKINQSGLSIDSTFVNTVIVSSGDETTETITEITPVEGAEIVVNPDGSFKGKAKSVKTTVKEKKIKKKVEQSDSIMVAKIDTTRSQARQMTRSESSQDSTLDKKTRPPIWLIVLPVLLIIAVGIYLSRKFKIW